MVLVISSEEFFEFAIEIAEEKFSILTMEGFTSSMCLSVFESVMSSQMPHIHFPR